jgi:hypothetical protein
MYPEYARDTHSESCTAPLSDRRGRRTYAVVSMQMIMISMQMTMISMQMIMISMQMIMVSRRTTSDCRRTASDCRCTRCYRTRRLLVFLSFFAYYLGIFANHTLQWSDPQLIGLAAKVAGAPSEGIPVLRA